MPVTTFTSKTPCRSMVSLGLFCLVVSATRAVAEHGHARREFITVGGSILYTNRTGSYLLPALAARVDSRREPLFLYGFSLGKRYALSRHLQLSVEGAWNFGRSNDGEIPRDATEQFYYRHAACLVTLGISLPAQAGLRPVLLVGSGLNYLHSSEHFFFLDDPEQEVVFEDYPAVDVRRISPSLHAGLGLDLTPPRRNVGLSLAYSFRLWRPVKYDYHRNLPLFPVEYRETFLTHCGTMSILFELGN